MKVPFEIIRSGTSLEFVLRFGGVVNDEALRRVEIGGRLVEPVAE